MATATAITAALKAGMLTVVITGFMALFKPLLFKE